jgi:hypothetical protein
VSNEDLMPEGQSTERGGRAATTANTAMPLWFKIGLVIAIVAALTVVVLLIVGGGHGPGRHSGAGTDTSSAVVLVR